MNKLTPATAGPRIVVGDFLAWLILAGAATTLLARMLPLGGIDFQQFWVVAASARGPGRVEHFYSPEGREAIASAVRERAAEGLMGRRELSATRSNFEIGTSAERHAVLPTATPFLFAAFGLLGTICGWDFETAVIAYRVSAACAAMLAVYLVLAGSGFSPSERLLGATALGLLPECVQSDLRVANVSLVHLCALAAACRALQGQGAAARIVGGGLVGLATVFKPSIFGALPALALLCVAERRPRLLAEIVAGAATGAVAGIAAGAVWGGSWSVWLEWLEAMREMAVPGKMFASQVRDGNMALMQVCAELLGFRPRAVVAVVLAMCWAAAVVIRCRGVARSPAALRSQIAPVTFAGVVTGLFLVDLAWLHYFVFIIPLVVAPWIGGRDRLPARMSMPVAIGLMGATYVGLFGIPAAGIMQLGPMAAVAASNIAWIVLLLVAIAAFAAHDAS